eukprot:TRINITY_DN7013_c0_g1_i6.p2 TRINITY_DN7013_c0_g1~~TRINITY_DN7013_c0_g1_i6.p2  ORF type:complete len:197 (-),score=-14.19 TRINITY_DN7013_c0_g1_i6:523-1113(-)
MVYSNIYIIIIRTYISQQIQYPVYIHMYVQFDSLQKYIFFFMLKYIKTHARHCSKSTEQCRLDIYSLETLDIRRFWFKYSLNWKNKSHVKRLQKSQKFQIIVAIRKFEQLQKMVLISKTCSLFKQKHIYNFFFFFSFFFFFFFQCPQTQCFYKENQHKKTFSTTNFPSNQHLQSTTRAQKSSSQNILYAAVSILTV